MDKLPIVYVRGYAGPTAGIDTAVEDPFYGFNAGPLMCGLAEMATRCFTNSRDLCCA